MEHRKSDFTRTHTSVTHTSIREILKIALGGKQELDIARPPRRQRADLRFS